MTRTELVALLARQLEAWREGDGVLGVMLVRLQRVREFGLFYGFGAGDALGAAALARIGNNLNQLAKLSNSGLPLPRSEILGTLAAVRAAVDRL